MRTYSNNHEKKCLTSETASPNLHSTGKERPQADTRNGSLSTNKTNVTTGRVISGSESKQRNDVQDYLSGTVTGGYPMGSGARVGTRETSGRGTDSEPIKRFRRVAKRQANGQTIHGNNGER